MAIPTSSSANNFGTFLETVNAGRDRPGGGTQAFDIESAAKQALEILHKGAASNYTFKAGELYNYLGLRPEQVHEVINYLKSANMVEATGDGASTLIRLTDYAMHALKIFSVR